MKILVLICLLIGLAQTRWICYNWSNDDRALGAGTGNATTEKWICEMQPNRRFTHGSGLCGGCWCCQDV